MNHVFQSTDSGAPVLTGENGAIVNLIRKFAVDGYGSVNVSSMTRSGSVVTVNTSAPHNFQDYATIQIAGASEADYNGKWRVATVVDSDTLTFDIGVATPATPATGTITVKRAPLGWTEAFTGTNAASFRMPVGSNQHYLDVNDNAVDSARSASVRGYRAMTALATGTEPFPTAAQVANCYWRKSNAASNSPRPWVVFADDRGFWLGINWHASFTDCTEVVYFGQDVPWNGADVYMTRLSYAQSVASTAGNPGASSGAQFNFRSFSGAGSHWAGDIGGTPGAPQQCNYDTCVSSNQFNSDAANNSTVPGVVTGEQIIAPAYGITPTAPIQVRGRLPGIFPALYAQPTVPLLTVKNDFIEYPGKRFMAVRHGAHASGSQRTPVYFDIDGPWR
jgi:hypothetical protein